MNYIDWRCALALTNIEVMKMRKISSHEILQYVEDELEFIRYKSRGLGLSNMDINKEVKIGGTD